MIHNRKIQPHSERREKTSNNYIMRNIIYLFKPIMMMQQILGIFRLRVKNKEVLPTDGKLKCFGIIIVSVFVGLRVTYYLHIQSVSAATANQLLYMYENLCLVLILTDYIAMLVTHTLVKSKNNVQIMLYFAQLDLKLHYNAKHNFYENCRSYTMYIIIFVILINTTFAFCYYMTNNVSLVHIFTVNIMYLLQDNETAFVCLMIFMLKFRLATINNILKKIISERKNTEQVFPSTIQHENIKMKSQLVASESSSLKRLHDLSLAFDMIGEACSLINKLFNFHIFMVLLSIFIYILFTLWTFLYIFRTDRIVHKDLVTTICWCSNKFSFLIILSFVCECLLWTRSDSKELVNALVMDYELPASVRAQAKAFMELIDAWPLRIEVYDMFAVDISLILKFISVSTTYLIIIIQISHVV